MKSRAGAGIAGTEAFKFSFDMQPADAENAATSGVGSSGYSQGCGAVSQA
jgi:hypothetical protein